MSSSEKRPFLSAWVDIFAMNSFSYIVALPIELIIAGMSWQEHLKVRLAALVLNTLVARPFGIWRDFVIKRFGIREDSRFIKVYLVDTLVFLSFQLPLYVGNMILGGADWGEIMKASVTVSLIAGLLGRPYGIYLDFIKRRVGLSIAFEKAK
ncbi:L-alanine exporter AlaE [Pleionea sp. CnH1-48]|uniref:L-alanine exporter AlaE n=1 Tax=Pleionea sp. CnH1-48 TaxID=2954494 RepID=UPI0020982F24|nr:L-alanine exporter AlaE [Pleionea sp. CnH1-48]